MVAFICRRLLSGVALVFVVSALTAFLIYAGGMDIARNILGTNATEEQVAQRAAELGLDRPAWEQYADWLGSALTGDLGRSYFSSEPVLQALSTRLPVTLSVVLTAVLITAVLSAALGVLAAVRRGWVDRFVQLANVVVGAIPNFWLALVLVSVFALNLRLFPATGYVPFLESPTGWLLSITLPVASLVIGGLGAAMIVRSSVIDVLRLDFVRTLRSRGLSHREVLTKHVMRNAAPPFLTVMSLSFIGMFGGAVVIEKVFAIPGVGTLANNAAQRGDVPLVLGVVSVTVAVVVVVNLVIDILNGWLNPKVRVQ